MFATLNRRIRNVLIAAVLPVTMGMSGASFAQIFAPPAPAPVAPAVNPATVHEVDGQVFHYAVPAGWNANETSSGVTVISPDGTAFFGLTAFPIQQGQYSSPTQVLQAALQGPGIQNLQILQTQPMQTGQGIVAAISFNLANGLACRGMVCLSMVQTQTGQMGVLTFAACSADQFQTQAQTLVQLAGQIRLKTAPVAAPPVDPTPAPAPAPAPTNPFN